MVVALDSRLPSPPFVEVEGVINLRSVGGNSTQTGQMVKHNIIYRSGDVSGITKKGREQFAHLGVHTVFDFRADNEIKNYDSETPGIEGVEIIRAPAGIQNSFDPVSIAIRLKKWETDELDAFLTLYQEILETAAEAFRKVFLHLRDHPDRPCLVHCTAGKDRTGIFITLLMMVIRLRKVGILGVEDSQIVEEYALTTIGLAPALPLLTKKLEKMQVFRENWKGATNMGSSKPETMAATLQLIQEKYGGAELYFKQFLNLNDDDIGKIRKSYLYMFVGLAFASNSRTQAAPPRASSISTHSSSTGSDGSRSTANTSPLLNNNQVPFPPESSSKGMQPAEDQNAFASTSTGRPYYPMRAEEYMSFQTPFPNPSTPPAFSQSPSPLPIPNAGIPIPLMMPVPEPDVPPSVSVAPHDSGIDFGPGVRPPSRTASTLSPLPNPPEPPAEAPLFRARSLMGFAKTQSRLGFVKPRPPSSTALIDPELDSDSDSELAVTPHFNTYEEAARILINELRPVMESCIEIIVRLIPDHFMLIYWEKKSPKAPSTDRLMRLKLGREEEVCSLMEGTLRHLWSCITLRPGCACPSEREQWDLPEGQRGSDICREFHEAFERKLRRFTTRMRTFHDQIDRPRRMYKASFTERLLGWQDAFDQWINRFEVGTNSIGGDLAHFITIQRLNAYLRLRLAHAHAKQLHLQLERERALLTETPLSESESGDSPRSRNGRRHLTMAIEQLKDEYDAAKGALLEAHKRAAGLAWRRDEMGQLVRDFGTWAIREAI
ncbi:hypothetical protein GYMLUDRAFT_51940 [Collybiopsis luxurians FD-317 M1]|nr:hypothetical protein GYMLUDRAFT_51940 [Collybiopsis luxurians FD-317 M1]